MSPTDIVRALVTAAAAAGRDAQVFSSVAFSQICASGLPKFLAYRHCARLGDGGRRRGSRRPGSRISRLLRVGAAEISCVLILFFLQNKVACALLMAATALVALSDL